MPVSEAILISPLTSFLSFRLVTMTIVAVFCSQIILQKSFTVSSFGPTITKSKDENTQQEEERCWEIRNIHSWFLEACAHMSPVKYRIHLPIHPPTNWTFPPCMCQALQQEVKWGCEVVKIKENTYNVSQGYYSWGLGIMTPTEYQC